MWRREEFELLDRHDGVYSLACLFKSRRTGQTWYSVGVYALNNVKDRRVLWRELGDIVGIWDFPGCIGGDFNIILFTEEKNRACTITRGMRNFTKFIMDWNLIDLPLCGAKYTCTNGQADPTYFRIDRFIVNSSWEELFPDTTQSAKPRPVSDHIPLLLSTQGVRSGPLFYKLEHIWLEDPSLKDKIAGWWSEFQVEGNPRYILWKKLQWLKQKLKTWNWETFGSINAKMGGLLEDIKEIYFKGERNWATSEESEKKVDLKLEYKKWSRLEDIRLRQKNKDKWVEEGDNNTRYFHRIVNHRIKLNYISCLKIVGELQEDPKLIHDHIDDFYKELYFESFPDRPKLLNIDFSIMDEERMGLERTITEEEVTSTLKAMEVNMAPGPDGYTVEFFKVYWDVVGPDFMAVVKHFETTGSLDWRINNTLVALVPKKDCVEEVKDFRPISLINKTYKIIAKTLSSRMKHVLPRLISTSQSSCIQGRQIIDSILMANECIDSNKRLKEPEWIFKLDVEKAYDKVNWGFLIWVLRKMGFGFMWRKWILSCISHAHFSVLVNGEDGEKIQKY